MSMSLDGYITGPNDGVDLPLGQGGEQLHRWLYDLASWRGRHGIAGGESTADADVVAQSFESVGAFVMGRRMFEVGVGPWGDNPPFHRPVFVLTHHARDALVKEGGTRFVFVTDGIESALEQARAVAGEEDVSLSGGAAVIQQYLRAGLIDEIQVHLIPVLLGGGRRLFEDVGDTPVKLEMTRVIDSPGVTHLRFQVARSA